jgi:hypothetical protein
MGRCRRSEAIDAESLGRSRGHARFERATFFAHREVTYVIKVGANPSGRPAHSEQLTKREPQQGDEPLRRPPARIL